MSQIKISQLPILTSINANTSNTLFAGVDIPSGITGQMTVHTLAQGLFSNEILNVGVTPVTLPNTVAQFSLAGESYIQTNLVNTNGGGTADIVVTANNGTDSTYFIDLGLANPAFQPGLEFNNLGTAINPLDGYLYVQGGSGLGGNLTIGTTTTNTEVRFIGGGYNSANVVAKITGDGFKMVNGHPIYFTDGTTQNTAASPVVYTQAAFALANTNANNIATQALVDLTQNTSIQAAFIKANNALANTNGVVTIGDFGISGNLSVKGVGAAGVFTINATSYPANTPAFTITGSNNFTTVLPSNQGYMMQITGFANTASRIINDAFGSNSYPVYVGRAGRGSAAAPSASANGDILLRMSGNGYANSFSQFGQARIDFVADENFTDTAKGTQIQFWNTITGSNTLNKIASLNATQAQFFGYVNPQKGFVYTPLVYPGAQTAITIDVANNSLVRAQTATGLTVTLSNLLAGKEVLLWITNNAVGNQTFTTGVSALNSTLNSTTYTMPGTSTILVRYMSIDGTTQNTFVSITHA